MQKKKVRQSNIELLRIFAILLIIVNHLALHTDWQVDKTVNMARLMTQWLGVGGRLGVNIFILITGYFLINSQFKWRSLTKLWVQVVVYAWAIYFIFHQWPQLGQAISNNQLRISVFPIFFNQWWFITAYMGMYVLMPYLNKFAKALTQREYLQFLAVFGVIGSIWPTLSPTISVYSDVVWMGFVYLVGAYIRLYPDSFEKLKTSTLVIGWLTVALVMLGSIQMMNWFNSLDANRLIEIIRSIGITNTRFANAPMSPLSLLLAVIIFLVFLRLRIPANRLINTLAANVFGVYLLQSSSIGHKWLWDTVDAQRFHTAGKIFVYAVSVDILVFVVGSLLVFGLNYLTNPLENLIFGPIDNFLKRRKVNGAGE